MLKLCVYGVAGSGKSTVSNMISDVLTSRGHNVEVIKLAHPLYRLQQHIYATAGLTVPFWTHDNDMLRTLATQLRRINQTFIVEDFLSRLHASTADVVINDDLRDPDVDYPRMVDSGFRFLHVTCADRVRAARMQRRGDVTVVPDSVSIWGFDRITADWSIDNSSDDPTHLRHQVGVVLDKWLDQRRDV
jgi:dephospho-CoA kinase